MAQQRRQLIGIIGDTDGQLKRALEELDSRDSRPNVGSQDTEVSKLGMGTGEAPPEGGEPDFLHGIPPWAGRPGIQ